MERGRRGNGAIAWTVRDTTLGRLLVAASARGVCRVRFGESDGALEAALRRELPWAELRRDDARLRPWSDAMCAAVEGRGDPDGVPLDVRGSRFQRRVWDALRRIPRGAARTYGELARALGRPGAARAVARACGANPVAVLVPCHRAVARDGTGGYAYGAARKRALLARERSPEATREEGPRDAAAV